MNSEPSQFENAQNQAERSGRGLGRFLNEQPLLVGLAAVLVGAFIALLLPQTRRENRLMGQQSGALISRVKEVAGATLESVKETASKEFSGLAEDAKEAAHAAEETATKAADTAKATTQKAAEEEKIESDAKQQGAAGSETN